MKASLSIIAITLFVTGCSSGSSSSLVQGKELPSSVVCVPHSSINDLVNIAVSYGCTADVDNEEELNALNVSLGIFKTDSAKYGNYCTATPVAYDNSGKNTWILTASHCFSTGDKSATELMSASNIKFSNNNNRVFTGSKPYVPESPQATSYAITTVLNANFCQNQLMVDGKCGTRSSGTESNIYSLNDIALVKVAGKFPLLAKLATTLPQPYTPILVSGYGCTLPDANPDYILHYVNALFFTSDEISSVPIYPYRLDHQNYNGYPSDFNGFVWSLVCEGDSGGGDFYWQDNSWYIFGVHSWGAVSGVANAIPEGYDKSANVVYFGSWIESVIANDGSCSDAASDCVSKTL